MSRDYDSRRRGNTSGSSKLRMDASMSGSRQHIEPSSSKRKELDNVMRKARESQSTSYWNKKLLEVEERDPNRWRHSGYKELYVGGSAPSGETSSSRNHPRSPRSPRPRSPHSPRGGGGGGGGGGGARSPRSPRERTHNSKQRPARSPSTGSTCSDRSCSVCSPRERRRVVPQSRSRSRSITPVRQRAHPKEIPASSSRAAVPSRATRPATRPPPPMPRPRTPPPEPQPPSSRHHKEYKALKEKEAKEARARRKEKHHNSRVPEDPRVPDPIPLVIITWFHDQGDVQN